MLESGYNLNDPHEFASRMERVLKHSLNIDRYEKSTPYEVEIEDEEEKKEKVEEEDLDKDKDHGHQHEEMEKDLQTKLEQIITLGGERT